MRSSFCGEQTATSGQVTVLIVHEITGRADPVDREDIGIDATGSLYDRDAWWILSRGSPRWSSGGLECEIGVA